MNFEIFSSILKQGQIRLNEPMARHTTFGIGGPADCFLMPESREEMCRVCELIHAEGLPVFIIGGGANLLVRDGGIRGVVISTARMQSFRREGDSIVADAGVPTARAAQFALNEGLAGMEFASGIPGTLGGAAFMNAGAFGGEMAKIVSVAVTCGADGTIHRYDRSDMDYAYRHSPFMDHPQEVLLELTLSLVPGDREAIRRRMEDINRQRHEKQPVDARSAGSTFKRPNGYIAAALIDQLGLKGLSLGGAAVSDKHAGFLINKGGATCADMLALIEDIQVRVKARFGVDLEPEVQIVGED